jgi:hypothetical protein
LEGGEDVSLIMDALLDGDSVLRNKYNLPLSDIKLVADFLKKAIDSGWSVTGQPSLIEAITKLWNIMVGQKLSLETINSLIQILKDLEAHKWDPTQFVEEAAKEENVVYLLLKYKKGHITKEEFWKRAAAFK